MMTRQHFQFIADTIIEQRRDSECDPAQLDAVNAIARRFARELHRTNSRFDEAKFLKACGVV
jgi:hypothetical protein